MLDVPVYGRIATLELFRLRVSLFFCFSGWNMFIAFRQYFCWLIKLFSFSFPEWDSRFSFHWHGKIQILCSSLGWKKIRASYKVWVLNHSQHFLHRKQWLELMLILGSFINRLVLISIHWYAIFHILRSYGEMVLRNLYYRHVCDLKVRLTLKSNPTSTFSLSMNSIGINFNMQSCSNPISITLQE